MEEFNSYSISSNKLFVGGLSPHTTQETILNHFSTYGAVRDCIVMLDRLTGRSRCFGFVTMENFQVLDKILSEDQIIDEKKTDCKRAVPKDNGLSQISSYFRTKKLFVGALPLDITDESFRGFFEQFGRVEDSIVMLDRDTGKPRGFGFITFEDEESTERVLENTERNYIGGKWIDCKKAVPKQMEMQGFYPPSMMQDFYYAQEFVPGREE